jgi:hypothetical protein
MKINVKVVTNSSQEKIEFIESENIYKVWTHSKPIENEANAKLANLLAKYFKISKSEIKLLSGSKSHEKTFEIK